MVALMKVWGVTHHDLHHEIYTSDPREAALERIRMILHEAVRQDRRAAVGDPPPSCSTPQAQVQKPPKS